MSSAPPLISSEYPIRKARQWNSPHLIFYKAAPHKWTHFCNLPLWRGLSSIWFIIRYVSPFVSWVSPVNVCCLVHSCICSALCLPIYTIRLFPSLSCVRLVVFVYRERISFHWSLVGAFCNQSRHPRPIRSNDSISIVKLSRSLTYFYLAARWFCRGYTALLSALSCLPFTLAIYSIVLPVGSLLLAMCFHRSSVFRNRNIRRDRRWPIIIRSRREEESQVM